MNRTSQLVLKALHRTIGPLLPPTLLSFRDARIPGRIHVDDLMLRAPTPNGLDHYASDAASGIDNIDVSLHAAGRAWGDLHAVLDLPCGYGRISRHLVTRVAPERVTACDIDRQAVRFCVAEFGVRGLDSRPDLRDVRFPEAYDLVFVGSLLTHLAAGPCLATLEALTAGLRPGGLLIFSTQGESCLDHLAWYGDRFAAAESVFRSQVVDTGIGHLPYRDGDGWGVTIHTRPWIMKAVARAGGERLQPVRFVERGWDRHQDVWTYQRTA